MKLATGGEMVDAEVVAMLRSGVEESRQKRDHAIAERDDAHEQLSTPMRCAT